MASSDQNGRCIRILIVNPNTSVTMTEALKPMINNLGYQNAEFDFFTCPTPGVPSINSPKDAESSAEICFPHLQSLVLGYDAFLVACYSEHPLVNLLRSECRTVGPPRSKHVTGIFEASVGSSLSLISFTESFGIVSTGKVWEEALGKAVYDFLGEDSHVARSTRFAGCETTGLNATELHDLPAEEVRTRMREATKRLLERRRPSLGPVQAVCLGCAGMVGLDEAVREACVDVLGPEKGEEVCIIDGVKAGVASLVGLVLSNF